MRESVAEKRFEENLAVLFPDSDVADEILRSVTWALGTCPDPNAYPLVRNPPDGPSVMLYQSRKTRAFRQFAVLFSFRSGVIHLHDIWGVVPDDND